MTRGDAIFAESNTFEQMILDAVLELSRKPEAMVCKDMLFYGSRSATNYAWRIEQSGQPLQI